MDVWPLVGAMTPEEERARTMVNHAEQMTARCRGSGASALRYDALKNRSICSSPLHPDPITAENPFMPTRHSKYYFESEVAIFQVNVDHPSL